ncbi:MAG: ATP-binding protein [Acidobacteriota bacterium]
MAYPIAVPTDDFDDLPCAVAVINDDGIVLEVNATLCQWLKQEQSALVGSPVNALFPHASSLLYHTYVVPQLKLAGQVEEVALHLAPRTGGRLDALLNARRAPGKDGVGDEGGLIRCVFMRVQERKRLESQLLTAKRAADEAPGLLFQLRRSPQGEMAFSYATDAMRTLFGVSSAQAVQSAQWVWQRIHPEDAADVRRALQESAERLQPWRGEFRVCLSPGEGWREVHATPRREPDGGVLWNGYMADVTERKRMEADLRDKAAAERANQAKNAFLSRVSHELRTPLNGILGFTRLLQMQEASNLRPDQVSKLGFIEMAGNSLLRLINEVLEISRIEAGHMHLVMGATHLDDVIEQALQMTTPQAEARRVTLVREGAAGGLVLADAHRLNQVLLNLLSNAVKYGPQGGVVRLSVARRADGIEVAVTDQGPGLSAEQQAQLFQPFNRLGAERTKTEGVGLGLVISRGLVELMGGALTVQSEAGEGCRFVVRLQPVRIEEEGGPAGMSTTPETDASEVGEPALSQAWRVLYVEDNNINAVLMQAVFEGCSDFELRVAERADQALEVARQWAPHVYLLDMHLPDSDGIALLNQVRQLPSGRARLCIAVSADAMPEDIERALAAGFADYWTKPLDVTRVLPSLRRILGTQPAIAGTM